MSRYWRHGIWAAAVFVTGTVVLVARHNGDLFETGSLTAVLGLVLSVVGLAVSLRREGTSDSTRPSSRERIDRLATQLADAVQEQWQAEWRLRRLQDPAPLQVGWASADPWLSDHQENIGGPDDLRARLEQITDVFAQVPSRRLVILGSPGSGKTVLTLRFTLDLLERRSPEDPIPVVFSLANWQPDRQGLQEWMAASLAATYPGATWGRELLSAGRVLPVLDGLDEIPSPMQAKAVLRLNAELDADSPALLTCRTQEYASVVAQGDVFTAAAVVELQPVPFEDASEYLQRTARPMRAPDGQRTTHWRPILDEIRSTPDAPAARALGEVLASPLMVAMARTVYEDTSSDPAELLTPRFHSTAALEQHLLEAFVPAAFHNAPSVTGDDARRWLSFLAHHLQRHQTRDLAWWQMRRMLPKPLHVLGPLLLLGGPIAVAGAALAGYEASAWWSVAGGFVAGVCIAYVFLSLGPTARILRRPAVQVPRPLALAALALPVGIAAGATSTLDLQSGWINGHGYGDFWGEFSLRSAAVASPIGAVVVATVAGLAFTLVLAALGVTGRPHPSTVARRGTGRAMRVVAPVLVAVATLFVAASLALSFWTCVGIAGLAGLAVARLVWSGQAARPQRPPGRALIRGLAVSALASLCLSGTFGLAVAVTLTIRADLQRFPTGAVIHQGAGGARYAVIDGWRVGWLPEGGKFVAPPGSIRGSVIDDPGPGSIVYFSETKVPRCDIAEAVCRTFYGPIEMHFSDAGARPWAATSGEVGIAGAGVDWIRLPIGTFTHANVEVGANLPQPILEWLAADPPQRLFREAVAFGLRLGIVLALVSCTAAGLHYWLVASSDTTRSSSPHSSFRADRGTAITSGIVVCVTLLVVVAPASALFQDPAELQSVTAMMLLLGGFAISLSAWGWLFTTRLWLCGTGRLPWRLMTFLDEAHRRGVLRQAGAVYQFRHARLQEQLAASR
ncbi:NACHT domain-containing protein [Streptomyces sp. NPDC059718]